MTTLHVKVFKSLVKSFRYISAKVRPFLSSPVQLRSSEKRLSFNLTDYRYEEEPVTVLAAIDPTEVGELQPIDSAEPPEFAF